MKLGMFKENSVKIWSEKKWIKVDERKKIKLNFNDLAHLA